jgi:hypothetical protein
MQVRRQCRVVWTPVRSAIMRASGRAVDGSLQVVEDPVETDLNASPTS